MVIEHGLARRVAAEAEPGGVLVLQQLRGVLCLCPRRLEDLAEGMDDGWVGLLVGLPVPVEVRITVDTRLLSLNG